MHRKQYQREPY